MEGLAPIEVFMVSLALNIASFLFFLLIGFLVLCLVVGAIVRSIEYLSEGDRPYYFWGIVTVFVIMVVVNG
jgi:hypothetical protein